MAKQGGGAIEMSSNKKNAKADDLFDNNFEGEDEPQQKKAIPKGVPKRSETQQNNDDDDEFEGKYDNQTKKKGAPTKPAPKQQ